jgi:5-(carboxyamino)imidazole ribonucleotide synthase
LRAILGWPLVSAYARGPFAMLNIIGELPEAKAVLAHPGAHLHLYGKKPRPGRKIGHITVGGESADEVIQRVEKLRNLLR